MASFLWWGIVLVLVGAVLSMSGVFPVGSVLINLGWLLVVVGVILALLSVFTGRTRTV